MKYFILTLNFCGGLAIKSQALSRASGGSRSSGGHDALAMLAAQAVQQDAASLPAGSAGFWRCDGGYQTPTKPKDPTGIYYSALIIMIN